MGVFKFCRHNRSHISNERMLAVYVKANTLLCAVFTFLLTFYKASCNADVLI